jgi:hypothetical protein
MAHTTTATYENVWPEYPNPAYWHDLITTPRERPFYLYTRTNNTATPPVCKSRAQLGEDKERCLREEEWRERQLFNLNARGAGHVGEAEERRKGDEENVEHLDEEVAAENEEGMKADEQEQQGGGGIGSMAFLQRLSATCWKGQVPVIGFIGKLDNFLKHNVANLTRFAFVWRYHLVFAAAIVGILVVFVVTGKKTESVLEYVLVRRDRSWSVA